MPGCRPSRERQHRRCRPIRGRSVEGAQLYVRYGCVNCHGPNGLGGVPNPVSEDKTIPALSGADFFTEFNTDQKIIDVIRSGSVLGRAPIVSHAALGRDPHRRSSSRHSRRTSRR